MKLKNKFNLKENIQYLKEIVQLICKICIFVVLIVIGIYMNYKGYVLFNKTTTYELNCGTVTNGIEKNRTHKSQVYRDLYIGVQFDNGTFRAVEVSPTTYMNKKVGDRVCFRERLQAPDDGTFKESWGILGMFLIVVEICMIVFFFVRWVFNVKNDGNYLS